MKVQSSTNNFSLQGILRDFQYDFPYSFIAGNGHGVRKMELIKVSFLKYLGEGGKWLDNLGFQDIGEWTLL